MEYANNQTQTEKTWLQRLKDESWEAELLVSVASIFAIFQVFDALHWLVDFFINNIRPEQYLYGYIISFLGYLAFGILGAFFVIHFALRAYWIGLVGLNSVFPDYSLEESAYSPLYTERMAKKLPKLIDTIDSLDEICSVIFSAAFTLLQIYLYVGLLSSVYLWLFNLLEGIVPTVILLLPAIILFVTFIVTSVFGVLANIKRFKQNDTVQKWYYKIIIASSNVMYGPLYKYYLQTTMIFGSNFKRKKSLVKTILFMVLFGMVLSLFQIFQSNVMYLLGNTNWNDSSRVFTEAYALNNDENRFLLIPEIQSDIIINEPIRLFIPLFEYETRALHKQCLTGQEKEASKEERWIMNRDCYAKTITVYINGEAIDSDFFKTDHKITGQFGLQTLIPTTGIKEGSRQLKIVKTAEETSTEWTIPFYLSKTSK